MNGMAHNDVIAYDADFHVAETYDQYETELNDVNFIRKLIGNPDPMKILEPFCGTGRILIPLALDGHTLHGIDQSAGMLNRAHQKIQEISLEAQHRISLAQGDALCNPEVWPQDFDLVILGCNCFYELVVPDEQERCIAHAFQSLKPGGHLFIDSDHMEGELATAWQNIGVVEPSLHGKCADGTIVESTRETIWFDAPRRLARFRRCTKVVLPDGTVLEQEYIQQKHPVSKVEIQGWLEKHGFMIEGVYGSYHGVPYMDTSPRAIFWARRI
jgi:SAM-dependent methyltransferase